MEKFQKLKIFFWVFIMLFTSCAKPTVVNIALPGDKDLNCKELNKCSKMKNPSSSSSFQMRKMKNRICVILLLLFC